MSWALIHKQGCGGVAFIYHAADKPAPTDMMADTILRCTYPDGSPVKLTDLRHCGTCGEPLGDYDLHLDLFEEVSP